VWRGGDQGERDLLASCYRNSLRAAAELGAKSIAFPAISCGVYRFPPRQAAQIAVEEVFAFVRETPSFEAVTLVAFEPQLGEILGAALAAARSHEASSL
jgi:O-acetyl-ADP-ribose deacetylase (regulator of RNase III)